MPHGGYHGTVKIGNNVVQQGYQDSSGDYQVRGGIDNSSRLDFNPPSGNQNNQNIDQQIKDKKQEIKALNLAQEGIFGANVDPQVDVIDQGFFPNRNLKFVDFKGLAPNTVFPATGATGIDAINLAKQQTFQNQQLNNLLEQQQQINLANQIKDSFAKFGSDKETADNLRKLFTGDLGDKSFFGINLGSTEQPAATVLNPNPYTDEKITVGKIRDGMTSPEYAQYMSELYDLNPALMEQIFPFGSGQIAKPILARIGEGIMGIPGASQIGQLASSVISPLSGLFTGQRTATPKIQYDNMGNAIGIIPETSGGSSGDPQAVPEGIDMSIYGSFIGKPGPFIGNIIDQDQDGVDDRFQSGPGEAKAPPYSPLKQPVEQLITTAGLPALADYASMAPQFTGSPYTNKGVSPEFLENLRRFYG